MPWRPPSNPGPQPRNPRPASAQADIVGVWPSAVWILVGTAFYLGNPQAFAGWKGALYFVAGTAAVALGGGIVSLGLRRGVANMLREVFPRRDRFTDLVSWLLRVMLGAAEGLLVALFARWTLEVLG
ncbi:hypothetical protein [Azospirillum rugosum]|uniref:Uncharacterized protein n=1 Tax=Azospirillum rugosum TaxID=416170 RepID=A0ABS4SRD2_9PROT|nr:hypothetical protein [Azospirillum rugosum]MBP2295126.1 hypothetical protein [Azospirillum rugosum]MDQ0528500.1 hypothetical protein [Azospirillum rugosum]